MRKQCNNVLADRGDLKMVLKKIAQCFPSGIMQFLNQHTSKYQKRSKHFVCTRFPGPSMFCIGWQPDYEEYERVSTSLDYSLSNITDATKECVDTIVKSLNNLLLNCAKKCSMVKTKSY